jgi:hypothetical protein
MERLLTFLRKKETLINQAEKRLHETGQQLHEGVFEGTANLNIRQAAKESLDEHLATLIRGARVMQGIEDRTLPRLISQRKGVDKKLEMLGEIGQLDKGGRYSTTVLDRFIDRVAAAEPYPFHPESIAISISDAEQNDSNQGKEISARDMYITRVVLGAATTDTRKVGNLKFANYVQLQADIVNTGFITDMGGYTRMDPLPAQQLTATVTDVLFRLVGGLKKSTGMEQLSVAELEVMQKFKELQQLVNMKYPVSLIKKLERAIHSAHIQNFG